MKRPDPQQLTLELEDFDTWIRALPLDPFGERGGESGQVSRRRPRESPHRHPRPRRGRRSREQRRDLRDHPDKAGAGPVIVPPGSAGARTSSPWSA